MAVLINQLALCIQNLGSEARALDNAVKSVFHCRYTKSSNNLLQELIAFSMTCGSKDSITSCITHHMKLLLSQSDDIERTVTIVMKSGVGMVSWASQINSPFMSMRRILIVSGKSAVAQQCIDYVVDQVDINIEVAQILAHLMGRGHVSGDPTNRIGLLKAYPSEDLLQILIEDVPFLDSCQTQAIIADEEFKARYPSAWCKIFGEGCISGIDVDLSTLAKTDVSPATLSKLIRLKADPQCLVQFIDDPRLSETQMSQLVAYLDGFPHLEPCQVDPTILRQLVYGSDRRLARSALSLFLKLGLSRDAPLSVAAQEFNSRGPISPFEVEAVVHQLLQTRLHSKVGSLSLTIEAIKSAILSDSAPAGLAVLCVRLMQKIVAMTRFDGGDLARFYKDRLWSLENWFGEIASGLFMLLIQARCFKEAFYVLCHGECQFNENDLLELLIWTRETRQNALANEITEKFELQLPPERHLNRDEILNLLITGFDPLSEHPFYYGECSGFTPQIFDELDCLQLSPKSEAYSDSHFAFIDGLSRIATLWDEQLYNTLLKAGIQLVKNPSNCSAVTQQLQNLFNTTFADRSRPKSPYERQLTSLHAIQLHKLLNVLCSGNVPGALPLIQNLVSALHKSVHVSRKLKLEDLWPNARQILNSGPCFIAEKQVVDFDSSIKTLPSKSFPKHIRLHFADGSKKEFLLKAGELTLEKRVSSLMKLASDICGVEAIIPSVHGFEGYCAGLIEWLDGKSVHEILQPFCNQNGLSIDVYRKEDDKANTFSLFTEKVPKDLLLSLFYATSSKKTLLEEHFARMLAYLSVMQYILGLGDRHLGNILVLPEQSQLVHVDLSMCLGEGTRLEIPETVPFRFTPVFLGLLGHYHMKAFRSYFVKFFQLLRDRSHVIRGAFQEWIDRPAGKFSRPIPLLIEECMSRLRTNRFENVEYQSAEELVDALIKAACDPDRLQRSYEGWEPWF